MSAPDRTFRPGFAIEPTFAPLGFRYGPDCFGPEPELRRLDAIRPSLRDPACAGPDPVYAIAMDVGRTVRSEALRERNLLYGAVAYAAGRLGDEPVRSQGHVHKVSRHSGWSPPEVYEIWTGRAFIYMQERAGDDPGRCFAVEAGPGEVVIVPPGWAHASASADPARPMSFGAMCDRDYGFEYAEVRAHGGLAWFPRLDGDRVVWEANPRYRASELVVKRPRAYRELGLGPGPSLWERFERDPDAFRFVSDPGTAARAWGDFIP